MYTITDADKRKYMREDGTIDGNALCMSRVHQYFDYTIESTGENAQSGNSDIIPLYYQDFGSKDYRQVGSVWRNPDNGTYGMKFDKSKVEVNFLPFEIFGLFGDWDNVSSENVYSWLCTRVVPPTRGNIGDFLREYGLQEYDTWEFLKRCNGNPHTDNYYFGDWWMKRGRKKT